MQQKSGFYGFDYFFGLHQDRSLLKETGIPGRVAVFSKREYLEDWLAESWRRRELNKKQAYDYFSVNDPGESRRMAKMMADIELVEYDEYDEFVFHRLNSMEVL